MKKRRKYHSGKRSLYLFNFFALFLLAGTVCFIFFGPAAGEDPEIPPTTRVEIIPNNFANAAAKPVKESSKENPDKKNDPKAR